MKTNCFLAYPFLCGFLFAQFSLFAQQKSKSTVMHSGAMKNVMWKGELSGTIRIDTLTPKTNLYGLGPVDYLTGELLLKEGLIYKATVVLDSKMLVKVITQAKAPFFVYAHVDAWKEIPLADSLTNAKQLESFLFAICPDKQSPFAFKLKGKVASASIHVVNLPLGSPVSSPEQAHKGQVNYPVKNEQSEIIGFFSTQHKGVFTHHGSLVHMHLITEDKTKMGHLDSLNFSARDLRLFIPQQ